MNESQNTCIWLSNVHPSVEGHGYRIGGGHSKLSHSKEGNTHYFRGQVVWECYVTPHLHVGSTMCLLVLLSSDRLATAPCEVCLGPVPLAKANTRLWRPAGSAGEPWSRHHSSVWCSCLFGFERPRRGDWATSRDRYWGTCSVPSFSLGEPPLHPTLSPFSMGLILYGHFT